MEASSVIRPARLLISLLSLTLIASCESPDRGLADYAQRATGQQARQNEHIARQSEAVARQSHEVVTAAEKLVEQDAAARRELIAAQDKLQERNQTAQLALDRQRAEVQAQQDAARQAEVREPVFAEAIITGAMILAALLPLLVTAYALSRFPQQEEAADLLTSALLEDMMAAPPVDHPPLSAQSPENPPKLARSPPDLDHRGTVPASP